VPSPWNDLARPPLSARALRTALTSGDAPSWRLIDVVAETGSTNADLAARARTGEAGGVVLVADHQTAARGRRERTWTAPPRSSLSVSVLLRPTAPVERWTWLPLLAGVAVVEAVRRVAGIEAGLKWPNDVLVDGRKLAGLLAEVVTTPEPAVVLGCGLNVSQSAAELPVPTATSLFLAGSQSVDRDPVLRAYLRALASWYAAFEAAAGDPERSGLAPRYRDLCSTVGQDVRVELPSSGMLMGRAEGIDGDGRLLVRPSSNSSGTDAPIRALSVGDVVHIRPAERA
jgi:BirA family transcriptional regulator, biotin operon repressor / biotin---[acetyl-CoA-carboxylase] ligase